LFVLYQYLTIHMRELGLNEEETAIMSSVTPVVAVVMPPLAGMVADRIGNFRVSFKAQTFVIIPSIPEVGLFMEYVLRTLTSSGP
jgi:MFS family permease